ncbi:MAG: hypothetical protein KME57_07645 [Scytonema hyalinum WJT4-NPBG1]|nr:hypothetical protein [Scytonema hyalinum WJT4-NPBG1]
MRRWQINAKIRPARLIPKISCSEKPSSLKSSPRRSGSVDFDDIAKSTRITTQRTALCYNTELRDSLSVLALTADLALQTIRPPKTDAATGDRPMLFLEFYVFFYSRLVQ